MTRLATLVLLTFGAAALGCDSSNASLRDSGGDDVSPADAGAPDAEAPCSQPGFTASSEFAEGAVTYLQYGAYSAESAPYDYLAIELYYGLGGAEPLKRPGTQAIGASVADRDYATCSTCVLAYSDCDDDGVCGRSFIATSGSLVVTEMATGGSFVGTVTDARFVEVTIDPATYATTPVADGLTRCVSGYGFNATITGILPCVANDDCSAYADTPYCEVEAGECVQCLQESQCAGITEAPHCALALNWCVECLTDEHCGGSAAGHFCTANLCGECASSFDCSSAAAPACATNGSSGRTECVAPAACPGDDGFSNQGPAAARSVTTAADASGAVCTATGQSDWHVFQNTTTGNVTFTLGWSITQVGNAEDLDLTVYAADGAILGQSFFGAGTEKVELTYLSVGAVYAQVTAYAMGIATAAVPYTLGVSWSAASCTEDSDCAATYAHQRLRGRCSGGACVPISGNGALAAGAACDSPNDCASGLCTYGGAASNGATYTLDYLYMRDADSRSYCVASLCDASHPCESPKVCSLGFCLPACTDSAQCPVVTGEGDVESVDGWIHATCDVATGACRS